MEKQDLLKHYNIPPPEYQRLKLSIQEQANKKIWVTKDGYYISIKKMSNTHLINTFKYITNHNKLQLWNPWIPVLQEEMKKRQLTY